MTLLSLYKQNFIQNTYIDYDKCGGYLWKMED